MTDAPSSPAPSLKRAAARLHAEVSAIQEDLGTRYPALAEAWLLLGVALLAPPEEETYHPTAVAVTLTGLIRNHLEHCLRTIRGVDCPDLLHIVDEWARKIAVSPAPPPLAEAAIGGSQNRATEARWNAAISQPVEPPLISDHEFERCQLVKCFDFPDNGRLCHATVNSFLCSQPRSRHRSAQGGEERG